MYGELIILFNFLLNVALLQFAQAMTFQSISKLRITSSAFCSAVVAVIFQSNLWMTCISFILLIGLAFSFRFKSFITQGGWLLLGTFLAGGLLSAVQPYIWQLSFTVYIFFCVGIACISFMLLKKGWFFKLQQVIKQQYVTQCEIQLAQQELQLEVYIDTGNECLEPLSRAPVHFVSFKAVQALLTPQFKESLLLWDESEPLVLEMFSRELRQLIRIVPITTVQSQMSLVPAFRIQLKMNEKMFSNHYVVFTKNDARFPRNAQMIAHVMVLTNS